MTFCVNIWIQGGDFISFVSLSLSLCVYCNFRSSEMMIGRFQMLQIVGLIQIDYHFPIHKEQRKKNCLFFSLGLDLFDGQAINVQVFTELGNHNQYKVGVDGNCKEHESNQIVHLSRFIQESLSTIERRRD